MAKMENKQVLEDGKITLYQRVHDKTGKLVPTIQAKYKISGHKAVVKSTGETSWNKAERVALNQLLKIEARADQNLPIKEITFGQVCEEYYLLMEAKWEAELVHNTGPLQSGDVDQEKRNKTYRPPARERKQHLTYHKFTRIKHTIKLLKEYVTGQEDLWNMEKGGLWNKRISHITELDLDRYILDRKKGVRKITGGPYIGQMRPISGATINQENTIIREIFNFALQSGYIFKAPKINNERRWQNKRDTWTFEDWDNKIIPGLEAWCEMRDTNRYPAYAPYYRKAMKAFVLLTVYSGLRIGEMRNLIWEDISFTKNSSGQTITRIRVRDGKTGPREDLVICLPEASKVLAEWKQESEFTKPRDFIFCHPTNTSVAEPGKSVGNFSYQFKKFLDYIDARADGRENRLTLYSVRHQYATRMLRLGTADSVSLAKNMGTSVEMIEKHYGHIKPEDDIDRLTSLKSSKAHDIEDFQLDIDVASMGMAEEMKSAIDNLTSRFGAAEAEKIIFEGMKERLKEMEG